MTEPETVPFEGVEKRLVIQFSPEIMNSRIPNLLTLSRDEWQKILNEAHCEIVSQKNLRDHIVYLLSESTLTVWTNGFLLKTCGRTTPFLALRKLLTTFGVADSAWVNWMTYSRLDFLHPQYQIWPHQSFEQETNFLRDFLSDFKSSALPAGQNTLYVIFAANGLCQRPYSMQEVLMTGVDRYCVRAFTGYDCCAERQLALEKASEATQASESDATDSDKLDDCNSIIRSHLQEAQLDEFWFDPWGYSANALLPSASNQVDYFSCHISPEPETSYASLEFGTDDPDLGAKADFFQHLIPPFQPRQVQLTRICVGSEALLPLKSPQLHCMEKNEAVIRLGKQTCVVQHFGSCSLNQ